MVSTWGMLAKSATDNETIEEAIARLILAHEQDAESHLGADESLQSHKAAEIIDASQNQGEAIRKRDLMHKMADANKAFAHFRW